MVLKLTALLGASEPVSVTDIRALSIRVFDGYSEIYATTGINGGMTSYRLTEDGTTVQIDTQYYPTNLTYDLFATGGVVQIAGQDALVIGGDGSSLMGYDIRADGHFGTLTEWSSDTSGGHALRALTQTDSGTIHTLSYGSGLIESYRATTGGDLVHTGTSGADALAGLGDPVEIASLAFGGKDIVLVANNGDAGVTSFIETLSGTLDAVETIGSAQGLGIMPLVNDLDVVMMHDRAYALAASSPDSGASAAISVMEVMGDGSLVATDHVLDNLDTRFGDIQALSIATVQDKGFVLAGGADGGMSLFALLDGGLLVHKQTLVDTADLGLENISDIVMQQAGEDLHAFIASQTVPGLSQFTMKVSAKDLHVTGTAASEQLSGGTGDDIIFDGAGQDTMTGGAGADLFVLAPDQTLDRINGFDVSTDAIDLSFLPMLHDLAAVSVAATSFGARMEVRGEVTEIHSISGGALDPEQLLTRLRMGVDRPAMVERTDPIPEATPEQERMTLAEIEVEISTASDQVTEKTSDSTSSEESTTTTTQESNDRSAEETNEPTPDPGITLIGRRKDDMLEGTARDDLIKGRGGDDEILGYAGQDTIKGGFGDDTLYGQNGQDILRGGAGKDLLKGANDDDFLAGGRDNDDLRCGSGNDIARGGRDDDAILGDDGDDLLLGQKGNDTLTGGTGADTLNGGLGRDLMTGGDGADSFVFRGKSGRDVIEDFTPGVDQLELNMARTTVETLIHTENSDALVLAWDGGKITLMGVSAQDISDSDLYFF